MDLFDIMGPVMVGPSSSHTAGAVRIGNVSRCLLSEDAKKADIFLHGSFALTGTGHGTDKAIIAGLLGMETYDERIPHSFEIAEKEGMEFTIDTVDIKNAHPNTVLMYLKGKNRSLDIQASSLGGGRISIDMIDGIQTSFSADCPTLVVHNEDKAGHIARVTSLLAYENINIATVDLYRNKRGGFAVMVIETDEAIPTQIINRLQGEEGIIKVSYLKG